MADKERIFETVATLKILILLSFLNQKFAPSPIQTSGEFLVQDTRLWQCPMGVPKVANLKPLLVGLFSPKMRV